MRRQDLINDRKRTAGIVFYKPSEKELQQFPDVVELANPKIPLPEVLAGQQGAKFAWRGIMKYKKLYD